MFIALFSLLQPCKQPLLPYLSDTIYFEGKQKGTKLKALGGGGKNKQIEVDGNSWQNKFNRTTATRCRYSKAW